LKKEEVAVSSEVASPVGVKEPEPQVVAEPEEEVGVDNVAEEFVAVAEVRLARVATPKVAEPHVGEEDEDDDCRSVVTMPGRKRRLDDVAMEGVEVVGLNVVVPVGPRGGASAGPRLMTERVGGVR